MYTKDQKILRFSMLLLFLALMIVYIIRYQVKGIIVKEPLQKQNMSSGIQIVSISGGMISDIADTWSTISDNSTTTWTLTKTWITTLWTTIVYTGTSSDAMVKNTTIKMLSWTSIYYGKIAIIEQLGIKYQYALTDSSWTWYIYLGTPSYDFVSIARALKGNTYTMATEQEILANKLFGNKVVFINLPEYKDKQVIMLIYMNDGIRLIQIDYWLYHKSKWYLKSLFID